VLGIAQAPALGAPNVTTPTISIAAKSGLKPVTGDVFVVFRAGSLASAQIKGSATTATNGLNLPGRHSCGSKFISSKIPYPG